MLYVTRVDKMFLSMIFLAVVVACGIVGRGMYISDIGGLRERSYETIVVGTPLSVTVKQVRKPGLRTYETYTLVEAEFKSSKSIIFYIDELQEAKRFYRPIHLIQGDMPRSSFKACFDTNECYEAKYSK